MTLSAEARAALERLVASAGILADELEATGGGSGDLAAAVRRHRDLAADGLAGDDAGTALRGANLLTTVNKGVGDAEGGAIAARAFAVAHDATGTAALLRADAGAGR